MARRSTLARLAGVAEDQWGLITRRQVEDAGVSRPTIDRLAAGSVLERVAHGVYRLAGTPVPDHLDLRAAWLQLAPAVPAWERAPKDGVVSHRSAAALFGVGHLPADRHEFTAPKRKQSRRSDVRIHRLPLSEDEWTPLRGLLVTRPSRTAADLLREREDPEAVAHVIADSVRGASDDPATFAKTLAPFAGSFGLRRGDGVALLQWLLDLTGDPESARWMDRARAVISDQRATVIP